MKKTHIYIIVALIIFIILRLPSLFEPHWYGDEGVYAAVAYALEHGRTLYTQIWDNKPPAIYWLYTVADSGNRLLFVRTLNLFAGALSIVLIYQLAKILKLKKSALMITMGTAIFLLGTPIIEGNIGNAENFFLPLVLAGFILSLRQTRLPAFIAGILMGMAFLFKFHPLFDTIAIVIFLILTPWDDLKEKSIHLMSFFIGLIAPILLVATIFLISHNLTAAMQAIFADNLSYATIYNNTHISSTLKFSLSALAGLTLTYLYLRKMLSAPTFFISLLLIFETLGAFLSSRPYRHYLLQTVPAISLYAGFLYSFINSKKASIDKIFILLLTLSTALILLFVFNQGEGTIVNTNPIPYYKKFISFAQDKNRTYFLNDADEKISDISLALQRFNTDSVYFYSNNAWLYDQLNIAPPARFVVVYHQQLVEEGEAKLALDLQNSSPQIIAVDRQELISVSVEKLLNNNYELMYEDEFFDYFQKKY